jgi:hypothetical protein
LGSLNGIRARAHLPRRHSATITAETESGSDQITATPPASTHDPLTDAQIPAIIVYREIHGLSLTAQNLNDNI